MNVDGAEFLDGAHLKKLRKRAGLTQKQVADELGVHFTAISKWERYGDLPDGRVGQIAEALGVSESELRGRPDEEEPTPGRTVRTSADVNRWRDSLARADLDFELRGILSMLPAFQSADDDWPLVVVTPEELRDKVPADVLNRHWDSVIASGWVEQVKGMEWVLRLVFPEG